MRNRSILRQTVTLLFVALFTFSVVACERDADRRQNASTPTVPAPTAMPSAATSPTAARIGIPTLPADSQTLNKIEADVNSDGVAEQIVAFRAPSGDGLAIGDWSAAFPKGYQVEDIQARRVTDQKIPEILAFVQGENPLEHYLYLYAWKDSAFVALKPEGGPSGGQDAFRSDYLRPLVEDGDFNGTEEIILCKIAENPSYLEVVFYEWDEGAFRHTTRFIAIPLHIPPEALTPTIAPKGN